MTTERRLLRTSTGLNTALWATFLMLLFTIPPVAAIADQHVTTARDGRTARVSLTDLDLSTPEGMHSARIRLQKMARHLCAELATDRERNFAACVEDTLARALQQVGVSALTAETRAAKVSLADVDLSTPQGMQVARDRLNSAARSLCAELARSRGLSYQPNFRACVDDTLAGALRQIDASASQGAAHGTRRGAVAEIGRAVPGRAHHRRARMEVPPGSHVLR